MHLKDKKPVDKDKKSQEDAPNRDAIPTDD
jgi:hypothetical protein